MVDVVELVVVVVRSRRVLVLLALTLEAQIPKW